MRPGSLPEQGSADEAALGAAGRDGEDRGADRGDPLVEQVQLVEAALDGDEPADGVVLVGGEEQPGVPAAGAGPVVVVGAAEEPLAGVAAAGPADVRVLGDPGEPERGERREVRLVVLGLPGQRGA